MRATSYTKKWPAYHLGELVEFLRARHEGNLNVRDISVRTGMSVQYISFLFNKDNMKLSRAERIAASYGYTLKLYFPQKEWKYIQPPFLSDRHTREFPNAGNLMGLVKYMNDSNKTINSFCHELGISNRVLTNAFNSGDIFIATLYDIVEKLGIEFVWSFENNE